PDGDDPGRYQVARRRQLLAADHLLVADAGEVDGGAHALVDLLDGLVVVLQRAHADALAAGQPIDLVADLEAAGGHRTRDDGAVPLHGERAVDRQAEPLLA